VIARDLPVISGTVRYREDFSPYHDIALVSFESHRRILRRESLKEDARHYSGQVLDGTRVSDILGCEPDPSTAEKVLRMTGVGHLLEKNFIRLSSGESRKVLIARALMGHPKLLVLDEPLEGLDRASREQLILMVDDLIENGIQVILVTHRIHAIPRGISHIICLKDNRVVAQGARNDILTENFIGELYGGSREGFPSAPDFSDLLNYPGGGSGEEVIRMNGVTVTYKGEPVFSNLSWVVNAGEKWTVSGPNGSGKSTLLSLISGDNPQAYANEIYLFGKRRGSGESIWDIKKRIGFVSSEFQFRYQWNMPILDVVASGFFDSVGLYRVCTPFQRERAAAWLRALGFGGREGEILTRLSFGEQKLVLIARAMVKSPEVLILDEPCQGLDPENRKRVLRVIGRLGDIPDITLIHVSHHREEQLPCFENDLALG
jgi:molybdate transport system ATP-binding protein